MLFSERFFHSFRIRRHGCLSGEMAVPNQLPKRVFEFTAVKGKRDSLPPEIGKQHGIRQLNIIQSLFSPCDLVFLFADDDVFKIFQYAFVTSALLPLRAEYLLLGGRARRKAFSRSHRTPTAGSRSGGNGFSRFP